MIRNIIKQSIRVFQKQKGYVLINIIGLSIGIACSLCIALFIIHELSFDQFNAKKDRTCRLNHYGIVGGKEFNDASSFTAFGPILRRELPEVEDFTRLRINPEVTVKYGDKNIVVNDMMESDSSFFNIFSIPILKGDKKNLLKAPYTLVLSESIAKKIFKDEDPIDKMLRFENDKTPFKIAGIMGDIPETSHFNANIIATFNERSPDPICVTYLLLKPNTRPETVNEKLMDALHKNRSGNIQRIASNDKDIFRLESLNNIHFNQSISAFENKPSSNPKYLLIFGSIAILIIIIAAINFMNLSTAHASKRAKEIGIKKVNGSSKKTIILQFLAESVFFSFISLVIAIIIIKYSLPYLNNLIGANLQMDLFRYWFTVPILLSFSIVVGLVAGSYPAFFLSSFKANTVLKGKAGNHIKNVRLRNILVGIQFSISVILIVGTIVMARQIKYMLNKDLGFNKEQLLVIKRSHNCIGRNVKPFKENILKIPGVLNVTSSSGIPGHTGTGLICGIKGDPEKTIMFGLTDIDKDFFTTYDLKIATGRTFSEATATEKDACILNESAIKELNMKNPFAVEFNAGPKFTIIGVVKNFHFESLRNEIGPYIFKLNTDSSWSIDWKYITVRLSPKATANSIAEIENVWRKFTINEPFQYFFLDQDFALKYKEERQNAKLATIFSILAIMIASLGLFGLTSCTIEQRTKEIGIRKTTGATVTGISYLISKELILLFSISTIVAWPLIYYLADKWLQNYYYRITLNPLDFLMGFVFTAVIALLAVSYQTIKLANINPVEALRYE